MYGVDGKKILGVDIHLPPRDLSELRDEYMLNKNVQSAREEYMADKARQELEGPLLPSVEESVQKLKGFFITEETPRDSQPEGPKDEFEHLRKHTSDQYENQRIRFQEEAKLYAPPEEIPVKHTSDVYMEPEPI